MNKAKVLGAVGLAARAGKMASGEFSVEQAVKKGKAFVVLVAEDASANTKKLFRNMCTYYEVPYYELAEKVELGRAVGKEFRASLACVDENLAKLILTHLKADHQ